MVKQAQRLAILNKRARHRRSAYSCDDLLRVRRLRTQLPVELIPDPEQGGFTARVPHIPACGEGDTEEEAIFDLREALNGYSGTFGLEDAVARLNSQVCICKIDLDLAELVSGQAPAFLWQGNDKLS